MPEKVLFAEGGNVDGLVSLHTEDKEGLGVVLRDEWGRGFRYVKNASATALVRHGCCLQKLSSTPLGSVRRVYAPDGAAAATAVIHRPAGMPMTGIGKSGSSTGCFGWVQFEGPAKVSIWPSATAAQQVPGCVAIGTSTAGGGWGVGRPITIASTVGGEVFTKGIVFAAPLATVTPATMVTALVELRCK